MKNAYKDWCCGLKVANINIIKAENAPTAIVEDGGGRKISEDELTKQLLIFQKHINDYLLVRAVHQGDRSGYIDPDTQEKLPYLTFSLGCRALTDSTIKYLLKTFEKELKTYIGDDAISLRRGFTYMFDCNAPDGETKLGICCRLVKIKPKNLKEGLTILKKYGKLFSYVRKGSERY